MNMTHEHDGEKKNVCELVQREKKKQIMRSWFFSTSKLFPYLLVTKTA